jgi:WD40 repeat protein
MRANGMNNITSVAAAFLVCLTLWFEPGQCFAQTSIKHHLKAGSDVVVFSVVFSPDGNTLAVSCGNDGGSGEIRLYSANEGKLLGTLKGHTKRIGCLAYTPDGKILISGSGDKRCLKWNTASNKSTGSLDGHTDEISSLSISPNGKQVVTSDRDGTIISWDLENSKKIAATKMENEVFFRLAHSPDGKLLAGVGRIEGPEETDGTIRVWDARTLKNVAQWRGHDQLVTGLAFAPNGRELVTCGDDGYIKRWDTKGRLLGQVRCEDQPMSLTVSPDGRVLALAHWSGEVTYYNWSKRTRMDLLTGDLLKTSVRFWVHDLPITSVAFSSDGKMFASGSLDGSAKIWVNLPEFE